MPQCSPLMDILSMVYSSGNSVLLLTRSSCWLCNGGFYQEEGACYMYFGALIDVSVLRLYSIVGTNTKD